MDGSRDTRKGRRLEDERQHAAVSDIRPVKVLYSQDDVCGPTEISPRQPQSTSMGPRPVMQPEPPVPYRSSITRHDSQSDFWTQNLKPAPDIRAEQLQAEFLSKSRSDLHQGPTVTPYQRHGYPVDVAARQTDYEYQDYNRRVPPIYGQMRQPVRSNYQAYQGPNLQFSPAYQQYDRPYYAVHRYENEFMNPPLWNGPPAVNPPAFPQDIPPPVYNTSHDYFHSGRTTLPRRMQQGGSFPSYATSPTYNMQAAQSSMPLYQGQSYSPQNYMINQAGPASQESFSGPTSKSTDSSSGSSNTLHLYDISKLPPKTLISKTAPGQVVSGVDDGRGNPVVVASTRKDLSKALDEARQQSVKDQDLHGPEKQHPSAEVVEKTAQEVTPEGSGDLDHAAFLLQEAIMDAGIDEIDGVFINRDSHLVPQENYQGGKSTQPMENDVGEEGERVDKDDESQAETQEVNLSSRGPVDLLSSGCQHDSNEGTGSGAKGTDVKSIAVSAVMSENTYNKSPESSRDDAQSFMSCTEQENIINSLIHCCTDFDQSTETKQADADNVCRQPPSVKHTLDQEIATFMGSSVCQAYTEPLAVTSGGGTGLATGWSGDKEARLATFMESEAQDSRQTFGSMGNEILHPSSTFEEDRGGLWYPYCETDAACVDYLNNNLPFGRHTAQYVSGPDATFSTMDWGRSFGGSNLNQGIAPSVRPCMNDYSVHSMSQTRQAMDMPFSENWDMLSSNATVGRQVDGSGYSAVTQAINQYTNMADIMPCPTSEMEQVQGFPSISFADFISESTQDVTATVNSSDPTQSETNLTYMWQLATEGFGTPSNSGKEMKGETIHDSSDCGGSEVFVNGDIYSGQTGQSISIDRDSHETRDELTSDQSGSSSAGPCEDVIFRADDSKSHDGGYSSSTPPSNTNCEVSSTCSPDEARRCVEPSASLVSPYPGSRSVPGSMPTPVSTQPTDGEALDKLNNYLASLLEGGASRAEPQ